MEPENKRDVTAGSASDSQVLMCRLGVKLEGLMVPEDVAFVL